MPNVAPGSSGALTSSRRSRSGQWIAGDVLESGSKVCERARTGRYPGKSVQQLADQLRSATEYIVGHYTDMS